MPLCRRVSVCRTRSRGILLGMVLSLLLSSVAQADVTTDQKRELNTVKTLLRRAKQLEENGKLTEASKLAGEVRDRLTKLLKGADATLRKLAERPYKDFTRLHGALEFKGISLGSYKQLDQLVRGIVSSVPFSTKVAPILVSKCGRCHVERQQGGVSLVSYAALLQGPMDGRIVLPNDADGSRLIEVIETGDMPRGGLKVSAQELATLKQWIGEGAAYDGEDRQAALASLLPGSSPGTQPKVSPKVPVRKATGSESVSFSRDLAAILNERCVSCHGTDRPRARLNLANFRGLLRGGENGPPLQPGSPDTSLLLQKLKGTAEGQRMPQGGAPLSDETIGQFETWIREGARFDAADPNQHVREIAAISRARLASHDELRADRNQLAQQNWRLVMPDDKPRQVSLEHFLVLGNIGASSLNEYAALAEEVVPRVAKTFRAPSDQPLLKGAMTLYFFDSSYGYGELLRMVEKREGNPTSHAHFRYSIVDAYAAVHASSTIAESMESVLTEQVAGLYISSLGQSPVWFRRGVARAATARLEPRSDRVVEWNEALPAAFMRSEKPEDFLEGRTTAADTQLLAYSYARFLMGQSRQFQKLLETLREGAEFDAAFAQSYGIAPEQVAQMWARRTAVELQRRGRRKRG